jgi:hypothetical protein
VELTEKQSGIVRTAMLGFMDDMRFELQGVNIDLVCRPKNTSLLKAEEELNDVLIESQKILDKLS